MAQQTSLLQADLVANATRRPGDQATPL